MEPNFSGGEIVAIQRILPSNLSRGEVIVVHLPVSPSSLEPRCPRDFMKRVIGLLGERIEVRKGVVLIEGQKLVGSYAPSGDSGSKNPVILEDSDYCRPR